MNKPVLFLTGPTGVGKSALSLALARAMDAEILSMDSMQVYRGLDIGTDKLSKAERTPIPHHLIDIVEPGDRFTAEDYRRLAYEKMEEIWKRGRLPLFVGGTGLYLEAVIKNFQFGHFNQDPVLRASLQERYERLGGQAMLEELAQKDPKRASDLHPSERKKIIRSLELLAQTGRPFADQPKDAGLPADWHPCILILDRNRPVLYKRINDRVDEMLAHGLIEENRALYDAGLSPDAQAMQAIGYREVWWYFRGWVNQTEMRTLIQRFSRNYAKRQITWFRRYPEALRYDLDNFTDQKALLSALLSDIGAFFKKDK